MLTLAFVSVVRAFWIWEKSSKFHVLLRIGTIAVAAFVYFGFTGRQILTQYRAEHSTEKVETLPRDSGIKSIPADSAEKPTKRTSKLGPTLPPLRGQTEFLTYVMLDSSSKVFCSSKMQPIRLESCNEIHNIFEKIPKTENDTPSALASVLQHDAVAMIFAAGQRWGMYGAGDRAFVHDFVAPIEPSDVQTYTPHSVTQMAESDYFPDGLRFMWNQPQMKLPKDTKISFLDVPSENQGPVCNVVRLERKAYYRMDFCFKKYQDIALPPQEYESEQVGQINAHAFEVIVSWTVERSHDATFVVADYDNWAKQLAGRIQNRLMF
jgi:hypothetical protein